jgi:methionyl aminopeptidase
MSGISIKTASDIAKLREGGRRLAYIVDTLCTSVLPGVSTAELDLQARKLIAEVGGESAFLGYRPEGVRRPYPGAVCISINEEVVHGIPGDRVVAEGDIVTIDCGLRYQGLYTDHAITVPVGEVSGEVSRLLQTTHQALVRGIQAIAPGATTGDIGHAIEQFVDKRYGIVRELAGHGVGYAVHEDPYVPNYGRRGEGVRLVPGMVIAIEPMLTLGSPAVKFLSDEYTVITKDRSLSAHFEHTIAVTEKGYQVLTVK